MNLKSGCCLRSPTRELVSAFSLSLSLSLSHTHTPHTHTQTKEHTRVNISTFVLHLARERDTRVKPGEDTKHKCCFTGKGTSTNGHRPPEFLVESFCPRRELPATHHPIARTFSSVLNALLLFVLTQSSLSEQRLA